MSLLDKGILSYTSGMGRLRIKPLKIASIFKPYITHKTVGLPENLAQITSEQRRKIEDERKRFNVRPPSQLLP